MQKLLAETEQQGERHVGIIRISRELLAAALKLPEGTEILDVSGHLYFLNDEIALKVSNPDLPATVEGQALPEVRPWYRQIFHKISEQQTVTEVLFDGWH